MLNPPLFSYCVETLSGLFGVAARWGVCAQRQVMAGASLCGGLEQTEKKR